MTEFTQAMPQIHALFREPAPYWYAERFVDVGSKALALMERFK